MPIDLESLNQNQAAAVLWDEGPLLVLAGPGSGKTRVLTYRVARLLERDPDTAVLALTFTNKAAAEMRDRVDQLLGQRGDRAHLCTFHSFATDVLRQHGTHLGVSPDFSLLTHDDDRIAVLDDVARALEANGHTLPTDRKGLLQLVDQLFAESYTGGESTTVLPRTPEWVPRLYAAYCDTLITSNRLDFGSLINLTQRLLREKPAVARVVRTGWSHVCVDEFQDTNKAQYDLLKLLLPSESPNLFVVADDDQIIYQWNGASPERLGSLKDEFHMDTVQLPENYRCPPEIVTLANALIAHNQNRSRDKKPIKAFRKALSEGEVVRNFVLETPEEEVAFLARDLSERKLHLPDCAILARTGKLLDAAASALALAGIDAHIARRKNDFYSPAIRVLFHSLRAANARHDRDVLRRLCVAWNDLAGDSLEVDDVAASAALVGGDFLRSWSEAVGICADADATTLLGRVRADLVDRLNFPDIVDWFLAEGWSRWADDKDDQFGDEIATWRELHGNVVREMGPDDLTLNAYLQHMDLAPKATPAGPSAVRCMTVHGSKGLEFQHVYLIGMAQEVMPSFQALKKGPDSRELEEERRNCFVAITRVQSTLTVTRAKSYYGWSKGPSQFLSEMGIQA